MIDQYVNFFGYYIGTIHCNISYNILKYCIIQFISLDVRFIINSLVFKFMNKIKFEMKEHENEYAIHTKKHKIWTGNIDMGENTTRRWGVCSTLFSLVMKCKLKENGSHYGVSFYTMA